MTEAAPRLHPYQETARDFLRANDRGAALFLDMGLGKTAATLAALEPRHLPALVVAPKRVAETVWHVEAAKWAPHLRVVHQSPGMRAADRDALLRADADVVVLGRDNLEQAIGYAKRFRTLVLDELSGYKSFKTTRSRAARKIMRRMDSPRVWGLTGTPAPNGLHDLWAQVGLLDGGTALERTKDAFLRRYYDLHVAGDPRRLRREHEDPYPEGCLKTRVSSTNVQVWVLKPGAEEQVHAAIAPLCLSMRTEGLIDLPPMTKNVVDVPLPPAARRAYRDLKSTMVADLEMVGGESVSASTAAHLTNRLQQVTAGALYVDDADLHDREYVRLHQEKTAGVQEIIDGTGSPVLVFYRYLFERDALLQQIPGAEAMGGADVVERWNAGRIPALVAHPASAGHGLNLQHGGHTIAWTSTPWPLEEWQQANKRLARQGQQHPVVVHVLSCPDTVDPLVLDRLQGKARVQGRLLDHLESPL